VPFFDFQAKFLQPPVGGVKRESVVGKGGVWSRVPNVPGHGEARMAGFLPTGQSR